MIWAIRRPHTIFLKKSGKILVRRQSVCCTEPLLTQKDFPLVAELAGECYQIYPNFEVALRNASACASLSQLEPAVGWLQTAHKEGVENLQEIINESSFDAIREQPIFKKFLQTLN